jgi:hypothetical protein
VGGPWFTVQESGSDWQTLDEIWISNGNTNDRARIELRLEFEEKHHES